MAVEEFAASGYYTLSANAFKKKDRPDWMEEFKEKIRNGFLLHRDNDGEYWYDPTPEQQKVTFL
jgi:hypothetical protein